MRCRHTLTKWFEMLILEQKRSQVSTSRNRVFALFDRTTWTLSEITFVLTPVTSPCLQPGRRFLFPWRQGTHLRNFNMRRPSLLFLSSTQCGCLWCQNGDDSSIKRPCKYFWCILLLKLLLVLTPNKGILC